MTISDNESGLSVRNKLNQVMNTYATASGTNTYSASLPEGITLEDGLQIKILFSNANTAASPTINMNLGGALPIKKSGGIDVDAFELAANGIYNLTYISGNWIVNPATFVFLIPSSDQTTTLNTAGNITGLSIPVQASSVYRFSGYIHLGCNNTGGVKLTATIPASSTIYMNFVGTTTSNTAFGSFNCIASGTLIATAFCQENQSGRGCTVNGTVTTAGTAGTVQFQFASGTSTQTSTIFKEGSFILVNKIG